MVGPASQALRANPTFYKNYGQKHLILFFFSGLGSIIAFHRKPFKTTLQPGETTAHLESVRFGGRVLGIGILDRDPARPQKSPGLALNHRRAVTQLTKAENRRFCNLNFSI